MGADSNIGWCDDTLNVWEGCEKFSAGCRNCYAEVDTPVRVHRAKGLELWGKDAARYETKGWQANLRKYVREARRTGKRRHIFAQSLSDTFEDYRGGRVLRADGTEEATLDGLRAQFFDTIDHLDDGRGTSPSPVDLLLLTKRIENVLGMVPAHWLEPGCWPSFVWIGCTVEDQEQADRRIPYLLRVPAATRFLSVEPQVGPIVVPMRWFGAGCDDPECDCDLPVDGGTAISWVIQGGESGRKARPFDLAWARSLRDQCKGARVAYFLKQLGARPEGNWHPAAAHTIPPKYGWRIVDTHGADESEWPADLLGCRAFPETGLVA